MKNFISYIYYLINTNQLIQILQGKYFSYFAKDIIEKISLEFKEFNSDPHKTFSIENQLFFYNQLLYIIDTKYYNKIENELNIINKNYKLNENYTEKHIDLKVIIELYSKHDTIKDYEDLLTFNQFNYYDKEFLLSSLFKSNNKFSSSKITEYKETFPNHIISSSLFDNLDLKGKIITCIGSSSSGKKHIGKYFSLYLNRPLKIIDCAKYSINSSNQIEEFIMEHLGTNSSWKFSRPGSLTSFIRNNPESIVILDNFSLLPLMLQSKFLELKDKVLTDNYGDPKDINKKKDEENTFISFKVCTSKTIFIINIKEEDFENYNANYFKDKYELVRYSNEFIFCKHYSINQILNILRKQIDKNISDDFLETLIYAQSPIIHLRQDFFQEVNQFMIDNNINNFGKVEEQVLTKLEYLRKIGDINKFKRKNKNIKLIFSKNGDTVDITDINITNGLVQKLENYITFETPNVYFKDIFGYEDIKDSLKIMKELLNTYYEFKDDLIKDNINIPSGLLLYGPPGTGKTKLAKAFANEAELPIFATTGISLLNIDYMNNLFKYAREYSPSIIFIDEIDAIGNRENSYSIALTQLLSLIDGFSTNKTEPVFIIAATNYKERIDPAILRSGRISTHYKMDNPNIEARKNMLEAFFPKENINELLALTSFLSLSTIEEIKNEHYLLNYKKEFVSLKELILKNKYGQVIEREANTENDKIIAIHEVGHLLLSFYHNIEVNNISIINRINSAGMISLDETNNSNIKSKHELENMVMVLLGGKVAENIFNKTNEFLGSQNDLEKATDLLLYGINSGIYKDSLGLMNYEFLLKNNYLSEINKSKFNDFLNDKIIELFNKTSKIIESNKSLLLDIVNILIKDKIIYKNNIELFKNIFNNKTIKRSLNA